MNIFQKAKAVRRNPERYNLEKIDASIERLKHEPVRCALLKKQQRAMGLLPAIAACLVALVCFTGCATSGGGEAGLQPNEMREEIAYWATIGAEGALIENPRNEIAIRAAIAYLDAAEANGGTFTVSTLRNALARLKELRSKEARLSILGGTAVFRRIVGRGNLELATPELLRNAGLGLRDGLKQGLEGTVGTEP